MQLQQVKLSLYGLDQEIEQLNMQLSNVIRADIEYGQFLKLAINSAQQQMGRFQKELQDINRTMDIRIDIGGFEKFADYFFDGLIADWIVQGKINDTLLQVQDQLQKINHILTNLDGQIIRTSGEVALQKTNRINLIESE